MIEIDVLQGSEEWHKLRKGVPTGSQFENFITPARGNLSKSCGLYIGQIIHGENTPEVGPGFDTYWTERGIDLEPEAIAWYEMKTGSFVQPGGIIFNDDRTAAVSPDGKIGEKGLLEVKCLSPAYHIKYLLEGKMPDKFKPQVHGGLVVSERKWVDFLMYCPGYKEMLVRVLPDSYTESVRHALSELIALLAEAKMEVVK